MNDKLKHFLACAAISLVTLTISAQEVPVDKQYHIGAGTVIGIWGTFMGNSCEFTPEASALVGIASSTIAGIGKEVMDVIEAEVTDNGNYFDVMDLSATMAGGIIGTGLSYAALKIFKKPPVIYGNIDKGLQMGIIKRF